MANWVLTFVLGLFCVVTGQTKKSGNSLLSAITPLSSDPAPEYGIEPLYGVVVEYGMPYARYTFEGTVASSEDSSTISGARVYVYVQGSAEPSDSADTDESGNYSVEVLTNLNENWALKAKDIDGNENGEFETADTNIVIAEDSLKGGDSGFDLGSATARTDIYMEPSGVSIKSNPRASEPKPVLSKIHTARAGDIVRIGITGLPEGLVGGAVVDGSGRVVWRFSGSASSEYAFSTRALAAGMYIIRVKSKENILTSRLKLK
jgi:putative lipoprotein (rSAM/lipoprotein system)